MSLVEITDKHSSQGCCANLDLVLDKVLDLKVGPGVAMCPKLRSQTITVVRPDI